MDARAIHKLLANEFGDGVGNFVEQPTEPHIEVDATAIAKVCSYLKENGDLNFEHLSNLTATDYLEENRIRIIYHLHSYKHARWLTLKVAVDRENPHVATLENVYPVANWLEREAYDLVGVNFDGHSDLRRILMPDDWVGHPLRKDFQEPSHYHGISTVRESMLTINRN